jgi:CheY-like chemotaxis protein
MTSRNGYLFVDDDPLSRSAMQVIITKAMKQHLTVFEDSADFMRKLQALDPAPEMILLDIHMKPHSGFELLAMIRASPAYADIPVVALTASVMNEEVDKLREAGFNGAIAKPFSVRSLPDLLHRIQAGETLWMSLD